MLSVLLAAAAYHPRILRASTGVAPQRHRPVRLDLEEVEAKAKSALDLALADLAEEGAASATKPYLTQEERDRVLAETAAKRNTSVDHQKQQNSTCWNGTAWVVQPPQPVLQLIGCERCHAAHGVAS